MAHQVQVNDGVVGIVLPDGRSYDGQVTVTLTDHEFAQIRSALFAGGSPVLTDLGHVAGTSDTLADLGDVAISDPQIGDVVKWDGVAWINAQPEADIDMGGGPGGGVSFINQGYLSLAYSATTVDSVPADDLAGVSIPIINIYANDADNNDIGHLDPADTLDSEGVSFGGYRINRSGADSVYFTEAGLYIVTFNATSGGSTGKCGAWFNIGGFNWKFTTDLPMNPIGTFLFPIAPNTTAPETGDISTGSGMLMSVWQSTGDPQDLYANVTITRVL